MHKSPGKTLARVSSPFASRSNSCLIRFRFSGFRTHSLRSHQVGFARRAVRSSQRDDLAIYRAFWPELRCWWKQFRAAGNVSGKLQHHPPPGCAGGKISRPQNFSLASALTQPNGPLPLGGGEGDGVRIPRSKPRALNPCNLRIRKPLIIKGTILRFMGSLHGFLTAHWGHEPIF